MSIRTKLAKEVLTKAEQKHLTDWQIDSLKEFKEELKELCDSGEICGCNICRKIGKKLGILSARGRLGIPLKRKK